MLQLLLHCLHDQRQLYEIKINRQLKRLISVLPTHYELGNYDIMEHLIKSMYRIMAKMQNLTVVKEEIFRFLRSSFNVSPRKLKPEFAKLLEKIKKFEKNRFETRAFAYLDIISWVESKVHEKPMSEIIHNKYLQSKHREK